MEAFIMSQMALLDVILQRLTGLVVDEQRFSVVLDNYVRNLKGFAVIRLAL